MRPASISFGSAWAAVLAQALEMRAISSVRRGSTGDRPAGPLFVCGYYTIFVQNKSGKHNIEYRKVGLLSS